jgi:hypothetical protein
MVIFIPTTSLPQIPQRPNMEHIRYVQQNFSYISSVSDSCCFDNDIDIWLKDIEYGNTFSINPNWEEITDELLQKNLWDKII